MPLMVTIQPWVFINICRSRQYDFNLVRHPTPKNEKFGGIRTRDPDHRKDIRELLSMIPVWFLVSFSFWKKYKILKCRNLNYFNLRDELQHYCPRSAWKSISNHKKSMLLPTHEKLNIPFNKTKIYTQTKTYKTTDIKG